MNVSIRTHRRRGSFSFAFGGGEIAVTLRIFIINIAIHLEMYLFTDTITFVRDRFVMLFVLLGNLYASCNDTNSNLVFVTWCTFIRNDFSFYAGVSCCEAVDVSDCLFL